MVRKLVLSAIGENPERPQLAVHRTCEEHGAATPCPPQPKEGGGEEEEAEEEEKATKIASFALETSWGRVTLKGAVRPATVPPPYASFHPSQNARIPLVHGTWRLGAAVPPATAEVSAVVPASCTHHRDIAEFVTLSRGGPVIPTVCASTLQKTMDGMWCRW